MEGQTDCKVKLRYTQDEIDVFLNNPNASIRALYLLLAEVGSGRNFTAVASQRRALAKKGLVPATHIAESMSKMEELNPKKLAEMEFDARWMTYNKFILKYSDVHPRIIDRTYLRGQQMPLAELQGQTYTMRSDWDEELKEGKLASLSSEDMVELMRVLEECAQAQKVRYSEEYQEYRNMYAAYLEVIKQIRYSFLYDSFTSVRSIAKSQEELKEIWDFQTYFDSLCDTCNGHFGYIHDYYNKCLVKAGPINRPDIENMHLWLRQAFLIAESMIIAACNKIYADISSVFVEPAV